MHQAGEPADDVFIDTGEMAQRMRALDWSKTSVGPVSTWPESLKIVVRIMLTSRYAMWMGWGPELTFFYNDAYRPTLGVKHEWALGQSARKVWAEIWPDIGPRAESVLTTGKATWDEGLLLFLERNGYPEETYHTFSYSPVMGSGRAVAGMLCVVTEDTARTLGERRLRTLRELTAALAPMKSDAAVCEAAAEALARNPNDLPFATLYLLDADGVAHLRGLSGLAPGTRFSRERVALAESEIFRTVHATGQPERVTKLRALASISCGRWPEPLTEAYVVPLTAAAQNNQVIGFFTAGLSTRLVFDEEYRGFLGLVADHITGAVADARAFEEERKRAEALAEIDRAKTAFFSNISHEFRTPLTLMLGPTEDALATPERALKGESLLAVHRNELRLQKLVNALLDFSRIEAGRVQASYAPTDLAALTADLASAFRAAIERAGLAFEVETPPLPEPVYVDHDMWEKIVLNLLSNALKFTFEGRIAVGLRWTAAGAELVVRDTGTGIPAAELPHLFERFHRVQGARSRTHEGSGIGLALVAELVRLHGGEIRAESEVGRGTTFFVTVPRGAAHLPRDRVRATSGAEGVTGAAAFLHEALRWLPGAEGAETDAPPEADLRTPSGLDPQRAPADARVLIADDNADMRDYLARILRVRWQVETVGDGQQALRAVAERPPDLVITDIMMPNLDGFGLLQALRGNAATRAVPVLMLSARAGDEARSEGLEAGADDYLVKPFSARELVARVATHLQLARLRQAAEREREKLHGLFRQAPVAIAVVSAPDFRYVLANTRYEQMVGRVDLAGKTLREAFPELGDRHPLFVLLEQVQRTGEPFVASEFRADVDRGDGPKETYFNFNLYPTRDADGAIEGWMVAAIDVSEMVFARRRLEEAKADREMLLEAEQEARRTAESANRAKDEFLAMVSHELRTPLTAILGYSSMLLAGRLPPERQRHAVEVIDRNVRTQAQLIEDLLDVSRIVTGKMRLNVQLVHPLGTIEAALDSVRPAADARGIRINAVLDPAAGPVSGDPDRLQQIVWNLLANAIKFSAKGARVKVELVRVDSHVEIVVSDAGKGIAPEFLPYVFERFRQADTSTVRSHGGLGLGLAIVKNLVELHGGTVEAQSPGAGQGAVFTVKLPVAAVRATPQGAVHPTRNPRPEFVPTTTRLDGLRVLLVDDEADTRLMLEHLLQSCGAGVATASTADEALAALDAGVFDVIVSDIGMPEKDGFAFLREVRVRPAEAGGRTPAIALTAYARVEDRTQAFLAGFQVHVPKPIEPSELVVVVASVAGQARGR